MFDLRGVPWRVAASDIVYEEPFVKSDVGGVLLRCVLWKLCLKTFAVGGVLREIWFGNTMWEVGVGKWW